MKKIILCFLFIFLFCGCKQNKEYQEIEIVSPIANQIQYINEVRLDRIVLDIKYDDENSQHTVLNKKMLDSFELKIGYNEIKLKDYDYYIKLLIYDDEFINNNYIYCYENNIYYANNIFEIEEPTKEDCFFYGWYSDEACTNLYKDGKERITNIYACFSNHKVFIVDYYVDDKLFDRQYVLSGSVIKKVMLDLEGFYCWTPNVNIATSNLRLDAVIKGKDEHLVEFYDDGVFIDYRIVKDKENAIIDDPVKDGYKFIGWSHNISCVTNDMVVDAIFYKKILKVNFYSSMGELLETDYVNCGESTTFDSKDSNLEYIGYSESLDNIISDLDVIVYTKDRFCTYYIDNTIYLIKPYKDSVQVPIRIGYHGYWVEFENNKYKAEYVGEKEYFLFNIYGSHKSIVIPFDEALSMDWKFYFKQEFNKDFDFYYENGNILVEDVNDIDWIFNATIIICKEKINSNGGDL